MNLNTFHRRQNQFLHFEDSNVVCVTVDKTPTEPQVVHRPEMAIQTPPHQAVVKWSDGTETECHLNSSTVLLSTLDWCDSCSKTDQDTE